MDMQTAQRSVTMLGMLVLGSTVLAAAADDGKLVSESVSESGLTVVSTTQDRFTSMYPNETVSWKLDVTSAHEPADLGLRLMPSGEMNASLSIFDCPSEGMCTALISDQTFKAGDDLIVDGFENTMNLRIDVTAGEDLNQGASMALAALVTGADGSVSVGAPGTGTTPVKNPVVPTPSQGAVQVTAPSSDSKGNAQSVVPAEVSDTTGQADERDSDASAPDSGAANTSPAQSAQNPVSALSATPYGTAPMDADGSPQALSPYSEPVFRGVLAATGGNVLPLMIIGLGCLGAGAAVMVRRKQIQSLH